MHKLSNNPLLSALNSSATPSSCQSYFKSWLNKAASAEIEFPPGTVRVVFDNKQTIGKRYRVKANQIQSDEYFKPSNWMFDAVDDNLTNAIYDSFEHCNDIFRLTRSDLLAERMSILINSQ